MSSSYKDIEILEEPDIIDSQDSAKITRCEEFSWKSTPRCFYENTSKEELVLEHVLEYKRQFKVIYDPLRKLVLAPKNERGLRKFICTTIRPTKLPYVELYDWDKCAKFVADYLDFEELEHPTHFPKVVPAPSNVLNWQAGDCMDFSIVLCSLLCGAGYDAYVVTGTAPKFITLKDESLMDCPFPTGINDNEDRDDPEIDVDQAMMELDQGNKLEPVEDFAIVQH